MMLNRTSKRTLSCFAPHLRKDSGLLTIKYDVNCSCFVDTLSVVEDFSLYSVDIVIYLDWLLIVKPALDSRDKLHLVMMYLFFLYIFAFH